MVGEPVDGAVGFAVGNAEVDASRLRSQGWFVGHFVDEGIRNTDAVELKWGVHAVDGPALAASYNRTAHTLAILISGSFNVEFPDRGDVARLRRAGDYVLFGPRVVHRGVVLRDSVVLTVRWPSIPKDHVKVSNELS